MIRGLLSFVECFSQCLLSIGLLERIEEARRERKRRGGEWGNKSEEGSEGRKKMKKEGGKKEKIRKKGKQASK